MRDQSRDLRDRVVRGLAGLSLIGVLALMGAMFIGSAAVGGTPDADQIAAGKTAEKDQEDLLDNVSPVGFLIGVVVIGGGLLVLMVGAFKPRPDDQDRELADSLRD